MLLGEDVHLITLSPETSCCRLIVAQCLSDPCEPALTAFLTFSELFRIPVLSQRIVVLVTAFPVWFSIKAASNENSVSRHQALRPAFPSNKPRIPLNFSDHLKSFLLI